MSRFDGATVQIRSLLAGRDAAAPALDLSGLADMAASKTVALAQSADPDTLGAVPRGFLLDGFEAVDASLPEILSVLPHGGTYDLVM